MSGARVSKLLHIRSQRKVFALTVLLTAFCVAASVCSLAVLLAATPRLPAPLYWSILAVAAAIPLLIAPPVGFLGLSLLRRLTEAIDAVDRQIRFDALTEVLSRSYLLGVTREAAADGGAFLMIDADHFKQINDSHGHDVGDQALKRLATALRRALPQEALLGRLGGEEFGAFLPGAGAADALLAAEAACAAIRRDGAVVAGRRLDMTVSVGVALAVRGEALESLMMRADDALYRAKRAGRDRCAMAAAEASAARPGPRRAA